ncbi:hypothetical protein VTK73DRAFT_6341 [Phialemonium thermophilum]|uniref:Uncharacterized protein n=1 Tax=Phialemonium thermophilum TaxID=223376 RepID=A0ABR3UZM8_9PEZI
MIEAVVATPLGNVVRTVWDRLETSGTKADDPVAGGGPPGVADYGLLANVTVTPYRTVVFLPTHPGSPPSIPYGPYTRLSDRMLNRSGTLASTSRVTPSPPRNRPLPPVPTLISSHRTTTGVRFSITSGSVARVFVECTFTPCVPCQPGPAPLPPPTVSP